MADRLISADAPTVEAEPKDCTECGNYWVSIYNGKPLVYCEFCKYHEDEEPGMVYCPNIVGGWVRNDFFCADGEREGSDDANE